MRERVRATGPYRKGPQSWRIVITDERGARVDRVFSGPKAEAQARATIEEIERAAQLEDLTAPTALERYELHLRAKGNRPASIATTLYRLRAFFKGAPPGLMLRDYTRKDCEALYRDLAERQRADTHRNALAEARTFFNWAERERLADTNPAEGIEGRGQRTKGKPQLRKDEARTLAALALREAFKDRSAGALAVLLALYLGLRAGEIVTLRARDIDDDARVLWVGQERAKTAKSKRTLLVPDVLRPLLALRRQELSESTDLAFPHLPAWVRAHTKRLARAAGVPEIGAHALRGTHASLAVAEGESAAAVARTLGHHREAVTLAHYAQPGAVAAGQAARALEVLPGGLDGGAERKNAL